MDDLKYNFVFYFARYDFWRNILGEELYNHKQVRIYKEGFSGPKILQKIFHYHWAFSINKKIRIPFKRIWFKRMYSQDFDNDLPIVFIYLGGGTICYGSEFLEYVKKKNLKNKNVMFYEDLISKCMEKEHFLLKDLVDLEITYDKGESEKYNIEYFQDIVFSKTVPEPKEAQFKYDVYFLGAAKDRLSTIHDTYLYLTSKGFKCKYIVTGVPKEKQIEGIEYCDGITYEDNLKNVIESRCLIEIVQNNSKDMTKRALEAISYRRKFITNCSVDISELFNEGQLLKYNLIQDIDIDFVEKKNSPEEFNPVIDLNPLRRLYFIQEKLDEINERKK